MPKDAGGKLTTAESGGVWNQNQHQSKIIKAQMRFWKFLGMPLAFGLRDPF